ncbi:MAG: ComEA family DNA-binding protein [Anaerolineales bacterium]|nr:ComEA family DNA-binding protein [Anaerolineales bacterium]
MSAHSRLRLVAGYAFVSALVALVVLLIVARRPVGRPVQLQPLPTRVPLRVHVIGEVAVPGVYDLAPGSIVEDAILAAGGARAAADLSNLNLARLLQDGDQVMVPAESATAAPGLDAGQTSATAPPVTAKVPSAASEAFQTQINVNRATAAELETLPGIGPALAARIITHRGQHGPFASVEDLLDVDGIGPAKLEAIRELVVTH